MKSSSPNNINVLIADDQTLVRQGIRSLLELSDTINVVGEAADGEQALVLLQQHSVDVLLLDLRMPVLGGVEVLKHLAQAPSATAVIVLTTFDDDEQLLLCAQWGAKGYLLKDVSFQQLTDTIQRVAEGESLMAPIITERMVRGLNKGLASATGLPAESDLTRRELEVLQYLSGGYSNREVGQALHLSEGTVKNHVSVILSKLNVRDRTRAVLKAIEMGVLKQP